MAFKSYLFYGKIWFVTIFANHEMVCIRDCSKRGPTFQMIYHQNLLLWYNHAGLKILTWDRVLVRSSACSMRFSSLSHHHLLLCHHLTLNLRWPQPAMAPLLSFLPETEEGLVFFANCFLQRGPKTNFKCC